MNDLTELDDSKAPAPAPADELISRHFDEPLAPEDHGRLTRLLHEDPQALLAFVATARLHQALENQAAALRPVAASRKRKRPLGWRVGMGIGAAAAAAALVAGGGWWILARPEPAAPHSGVVVSVRDITPPPAEEPGKQESSSLKKRIVKVAGAAAPNMSQEELEELLERYYVNVTPHGLTVPKALEQLKQAIAEVNILNRPAVNQLRFDAGEPLEPGAENPVVLTPLVPPMTVKAYLETCGLFQRVTRQPGNVVYGAPAGSLPPADAGSATAVVTRTYPVPGDFLRAGSLAPEKEDPFAVNTPKLGNLSQNPTGREILRTYFGLPDDGQSTAAYSPEDSTLKVRAPSNFFELFERRLHFYIRHNRQERIHLSSAFMTGPRAMLPAGFDETSGMIIKSGELDGFLKAAGQAGGAIVSMPRVVVVGSAQEGQVRIQGAYTPEGAVGSEYDVNLDQKMRAAKTGECIRVTGNARMVSRPRNTKAASFDQEGSEPITRENQDAGDTGTGFPSNGGSTEYELWVPDGQTAMITLDTPDTGDKILLMCLTPTGEKAQGDPGNSVLSPDAGGNADANSFTAIPYGIPVTDKPGFVISPFQSDGLVDVMGMAKGTKVRCPYTKKLFRVP